MQLTPAIDPDIGLAFESQRQLPGGSVEIVYACTGRRQPLPNRPASQPPDA
jgi:hypothetical protein